MALLTEEVMPIALEMLRKGDYQLYEDYYYGRHRIAYASEKWRNVFGRLFRKFADNLCPTVLDAVADRLTITGFEVKGKAETDATDNDPHEDHIREVWEENKMDYNAGRVHLLALRDGDAYVIVWPDLETGMPIITPQPARCIRVKYDQEKPGKVLWAVKAWITDTKKCRVNLYFEDRIEKYVTRRKCEQIPERPSELVQFDGENGNDYDLTWPVVNPYGVVPVFHFANNATVGDYGQSELRDVIPLQDAVNKSILDLIAGMEYTALPQRWAAGLEVEKDPVTNEPIPPFQPGSDTLWTVGDTQVKFGEFSVGNLEQMVTVTDSMRTEIARITGTPLHYFMLMSDPPSGEALKTLEARLIKKVKDRQLSFGSVWETVVRFAHIIMGHPETVKFKSDWEDPSPRSEKEHAETLLLKKTLGVPTDQLILEAGYTQKQVEEFAAKREEEQAKMADQLLNQFNQGALNQDGNPPSSGPPSGGK